MRQGGGDGAKMQGVNCKRLGAGFKSLQNSFNSQPAGTNQVGHSAGCSFIRFLFQRTVFPFAKINKLSRIKVHVHFLGSNETFFFLKAFYFFILYLKVFSSHSRIYLHIYFCCEVRAQVVFCLFSDIHMKR